MADPVQSSVPPAPRSAEARSADAARVGATAVDVGSEPVDSGAEPVDSGSAAVDSGAASVDVGPAPTGAGSDGPSRPRLDDRDVRERLAVLDQQLARLEATPGPTGELALGAVSGLAAVYGEALARMLALAGPTQTERLFGDELVGHLLTLHGLHPETPTTRVARVIGSLRAAAASRGAEVELLGIADAVARVRVSVAGCGSGAADVERAVRTAVLAVAPELDEVRFEAPERPRPVAFVPLGSLMRTTVQP